MIDERKARTADGEERRDILSILSQSCMSSLVSALTDGIDSQSQHRERSQTGGETI
jgi:hypothetical protein